MRENRVFACQSCVATVDQLYPPLNLRCLQDSLTTEDFNYSEGLAVNKNNYTLTFSGHASISSQAQPQEYINTHGGSLPNSKLATICKVS